MRFLSIVLLSLVLLAGAGAVCADHDGPGAEAGSGSEHPGKEADGGKGDQQPDGHGPTANNTPTASPSPSAAP